MADQLGSVSELSVVCRKKHGVICRRTPHFDEQSSPCLREKLQKENWRQNVKQQKSVTSKFQKCACNSASARKINGVTGCFEMYKTVVLKLLTAKLNLQKGLIKMLKANQTKNNKATTRRRIWRKQKKKDGSISIKE